MSQTPSLTIRTKRRRRSVLPGFGPTMGYTLLYLSLIVLIPLAGLIIKSLRLSPGSTVENSPHFFWETATDSQVIASFKLAFSASLLAALANALFGFIVAWTLVRIPFPGRRLIDAIVDLPFALPTAVSGVALGTLYGPHGWVGAWTHAIGWKTANSTTGVFIALVFIGLPFSVRTLQPAIEDLDAEVEEAAACLGATRWQAFRRITFPALWPAVLAGFALSFARAVGEYGSVLFIAGSLKIPAMLIREELEEFNVEKATVIAVVMLAISFLVLFSVNVFQWYSSRKFRRAV